MSYEKQTWNKYDDLKTEEENIENGAVVTDNRMNHIEEGIYSHTIDISNPHKVTAAQVGLGNIQNFGLATEDEAKQAISNAKYMTPSLTQAVLSANINSIAYANSADGTDGFTTVYPNLNLLNFNSGVTYGKFYGWAADDISWSGHRAYFKKVKVTPNKQYTISANWSNTLWLNVYAFANESDTTAVARYGAVNGQGVCSWNSNFVVAYMATNNITFTIPANVNYIGVSYASISTDTLTLQALLNGKPKLEQGSTATPWMPSSSEVTTADWPKYVGFSNTVKTNKSASDYTWFPVKDSELTNKVESHINNKANPHAVTASQVGAYTKAEFDSKLTDLSNKVIANKGNLASRTDLDNVIDIGTYRIGGLNGGTDIINVPSERSGTTIYAYLTVSGTTTSVVQELIVYDSKTVSQIYSRSRSGSTPTFSPWSKTVMADDSGKVTVSNTIDSGQVKTATIQTGYGRSAVITRIGNTVTITSQNQHSSVPANGSWQRGIGTLPVGFRPVTDALVYNHDLTNASKFSWNILHPNGAIDLYSNGSIATTDYILTSGQFWITKDELPS